jgi:hypothetical protein
VEEEEEEEEEEEDDDDDDGSPSDMVGWSKNYGNTHEPRGSPVPGFITHITLTL